MKISKLLKASLSLSLLLGLAFGTFHKSFVSASQPSTTESALSEKGNYYTDSGKSVQLLSSENESINFEITLPWEEMSLITEAQVGGVYTKVSLPGWEEISQAGAPRLPFITTQIGVPADAEITLKVYPGKAHTTKLEFPVVSAVTQEVLLEPLEEAGLPELLPQSVYVTKADPMIYESSNLYPGDLAVVANDGFLRQQRLIGINTYPVQYHPQTMELTVYESLRVEVLFAGGRATIQAEMTSDSDAYEKLLSQILLNYQPAKAWRQSETDLLTNQITLESEQAITTWAPPEPGWRVLVQNDGIYRLSYQELIAAGWPASVNPGAIQLFNLGEEIAIQVQSGVNGFFDEDEDYILFYGQGIESKYTADNVYWLTYGVTSGLRMDEHSVSPITPDSPLHYPATRLFEQNKYYASQAPGDENLERWMWDYINSTRPWEHGFTLVEPHLTQPAKLTIDMLGMTENSITPDHHVKILLNGNPVGDVKWDGKTWQTYVMPNIEGYLVAGANTVRVECVNDLGLANDLVYIDRFELDYANGFVAELNELTTPFQELMFKYSEPGSWTFAVKGFEADQTAAVYDVTNPLAPKIITGVTMIPSGTGFAAQFQDEVSLPKDYWVTSSSDYRLVNGIERDVASDLRAVTNAAEHIIVTHAEFSAQAAILRDHRISQGLNSISVDVQDIYDEFGYGVVGAEAIQAFLAYAYERWTDPTPSYVVLLGDGHYNPKDYSPGLYGFGRESYIPPYLAPVDPIITETAADNRYVMLVGDDNLPDMMLGRMAVNSQAEATAFVNKIIAYEQIPAENWQDQVLSVADDGIFTQHAQELLDCCLPDPYQMQKVYLYETHATVSSARTAILSAINSGKLLVNYTGHAGVTIWDGGIFNASNVADLTNLGKYPVFVSMACYDGYYHNPFANTANDSIAEAVTRVEGKGAVASWSATGNGDLAGHDRLNEGFFNAAFKFAVETLGEATAAGNNVLWSTGGFLDLLDTYLLFGDPATQLIRAPLAVNDFYDVNEDTSLNISALEGVLRNDFGLARDNSLTAILVEMTAHGDVALMADGAFTYTPDLDWYGLDTFTYSAYDGATLIGTASVTVRVHPVNETPIAYDQQVYTGKNQPLDIELEAFDPDSYPLTWSIVTSPANGVLVYGQGDLPYLSYEPNTSWYGSDSFTFKVNDGIQDSNMATVNILVSAVPLAVSDTYSTIVDEPITLTGQSVLDNDVNPEEATLTAALDDSPSHGNLSFNPDGSFVYEPELDWAGLDSFTYQLFADSNPYNIATVTLITSGAIDDNYETDQNALLRVKPADGLLNNDILIDSTSYFIELHTPTQHGVLELEYDGSFTYLPDAGWTGTDTFAYYLIQEESIIDVGLVTIRVNPASDPPVISDVPDQTIEEGASFATINLDNYVTDADNTLVQMTWSYSGNTQLTVSISTDRIATITIPNLNWNGSETITFTATDPGGSSDSDAAIFTVNAVNDAPVAADDSYTTSEDTPLNVLTVDGVLKNDSDIDGDALTAELDASPSNGSLILNADGSFTYTPNADFFGTDSFTYKSNDGTADSNVATVTIAVNAVIDHPDGYNIFLPKILR